MSEQEITEENLNEAFEQSVPVPVRKQENTSNKFEFHTWVSNPIPLDELLDGVNDEINNPTTPIVLLPLPAGISKEDAKHLDEQWAKQQEEHEPTDEELYVLDQQIKVFHAGIPQIERVMKFAQNLEADKLLTKATRLLDIVNIYKFDKERAKKALLAEFKVDVLLKLNEVLGQSEDDEPALGYKTL